MDKITAKLSDLAKIPYEVLKKQSLRTDLSINDKKKLIGAMNLRTMRSLNNNPHGMFGMKNY